MKKTAYLIFFFLIILVWGQIDKKYESIKCNFNSKPLPTTILENSSAASREYADLITKIFAFCGQKDLYLFVYNTTSADLDYACCGYNKFGKPSIIINETNLNSLPEYSRISILAHEIGHFNNRDIDMDSVTRKMELNADFFNGFWCGKNNINDVYLTDIFYPYDSLVTEDLQHPDPKIRIDSVKSGFQKGKKSFNMGVYDLNVSMADNYKNDLDLILTVDPKVTLHKNKKTFIIHLNSVIAKNAQFSKNKIFSNIEYVRYVIDDKSFRKEIIKVKNEETNFKFDLTKVWGDFPVTAIIRFKDYSEMSITKTFKLPE
ncbi:hypothetical protein JI747_019645 [Chryseobacterium sp. RG1]|uniref:Prokaryotic YEATS domain-containing protein n=1 Tax=Chryseobacterium tagetis TaxID=2801334 RepID=A0ABS8A6C4_9FLAO|nr:pYEATS domain-containing protein [Chryseobacterium tagetis]MCA6069387.1 hypothetical protein [Chryseobacterium tagetis]